MFPCINTTLRGLDRYVAGMTPERAVVLRGLFVARIIALLGNRVDSVSRGNVERRTERLRHDTVRVEVFRVHRGGLGSSASPWGCLRHYWKRQPGSSHERWRPAGWCKCGGGSQRLPVTLGGGELGCLAGVDFVGWLTDLVHGFFGQVAAFDGLPFVVLFS